MTVRNATQLVIHIENTLGWAPEVTDERPLWKVRAVEAGKINKAIAKKPLLLTWENLELAVEYLRRKRQPVKSPIGVIYHVEKALEDAHAELVPSDLTAAINAALEKELGEATDGWEYWVGRFTRAQGDSRLEVLAEWQASRG